MARNRIPDSSDEDGENGEDNPPFTMPGPEATKEQLRDVRILWCQLHMGSNIAAGGGDQALREAQLNSQKGWEENMELKRKLDAVTQQIPKRRCKHAQESTEFDEEIAKLGHMFAVMNEPWVDDGLFQQLCPDKSSEHQERFKSNKAREEGIIAELYDVVPEKLHRMLEDQNHFKTVVGPLLVSRHIIMPPADLFFPVY